MSELDDELMKTHSPIENRKWLWCTAIGGALLAMVACRRLPARPSPIGSYFDNGRLYRCIELIDSGSIHRGMDTNSLKAMLGEWLNFKQDRALWYLSVPRAGVGVDAQIPPPWYIEVTISEQGIVTDFSIGKGAGK